MPRLLEKARRLVFGPPRNLYENFEEAVIHALNLIIAVIIVIALVQLYERTLPLVLKGALNPLDHNAFEELFSAIFTLIIALEFRHSIARAASGSVHIIQVRTVVLIALLAVSRKFVILDIVKTSAATIASLAAVAFVLGIVYWLLRTDEARSHANPPEHPDSQ
jgi:uncharacterized membrane protein (DUF373 family)